MEVIKVKFFRSVIEAEMAKNLLESYGIKSMVQKRGFHSSGIATEGEGVHLIVLERDLKRAQNILEASVE